MINVRPGGEPGHLHDVFAVAFDQAWHQIAVTGAAVVAGSGDRSFAVTFATQTAAGLYRIST